MDKKAPEWARHVPDPTTVYQKDAEDAFRKRHLFYRVEVGTPWDHEGHLQLEGHMPREDFILEGHGVLANEIGDIAAAIEAKIREVLIPEHIAREEQAEASVDPLHVRASERDTAKGQPNVGSIPL